jgi:large subunit ribosomal protein L2
LTNKAGAYNLLGNLSFGQKIYNIEEGGIQKYIKAAGCYGTIIKQLKDSTVIKMPSGLYKIFNKNNYTNIGRISKRFHYKESLGKAGAARHAGRKSSVRGVAMNAVDHPHGGSSGPSRTSVSP